MRFGLLFVVLLVCAAPLAFAANDPGHDSLYVLLVGDSAISGSLNITQTLNASNIRAASLLYGDQLDIRANGSIFTPSSRPAIQSDANDLYLDSRSNLYLNTRAGTTGVVQVGPTTGSSITLNVSGSILQQNVAVCLSNGTNCISGNNSGNISSLAEGTGISISNPDGPVATISVDSTVCLSDGTNCPASGSSGGGWTNSSTQVWLANNATNVSVGYLDGAPVLFANTAAGTVGIGTVPSTLYKMHISNTISLLLLENPDWNDAYNLASGIHVRLSANSSLDNNLILTQTDYDADTEGLRTPFIVKSSGRVGINTASPNQALEVNGSANITGSIWAGGQLVCLADGTNCPASAASSGWVNDTIWTNTSLQVNIVNELYVRDAEVTDSNGTIYIGVDNGTEAYLQFDTNETSNGSFRFSHPIFVPGASPAITFYDKNQPYNTSRYQSMVYNATTGQISTGDAFVVRFGDQSGAPIPGKTMFQIGTRDLSGASGQGTFFGFNTPGSFSGDLMQLQVNDQTRFRVTYFGDVIIRSGTMSNSAPIINTEQTWNNAAAVFSAWQLNIVDTASNESSALIDLQVNSTPAFNVTRNGTVNVGGNTNLQTGNSMCFNAGCTARIYHNGSALIIEGQ